MGVSYVTESIPLSAALRVQGVSIVEDDVFYELFDVVLEGLTLKCRWVWNVQRKTAGGSWPSYSCLQDLVVEALTRDESSRQFGSLQQLL